MHLSVAIENVAIFYFLSKLQLAIIGVIVKVIIKGDFLGHIWVTNMTPITNKFYSHAAITIRHNIQSSGPEDQRGSSLVRGWPLSY
jgi:hypothetical protein